MNIRGYEGGSVSTDSESYRTGLIHGIMSQGITLIGGGFGVSLMDAFIADVTVAIENQNEEMLPYSGCGVTFSTTFEEIPLVWTKVTDAGGEIKAMIPSKTVDITLKEPPQGYIVQPTLCTIKGINCQVVQAHFDVLLKTVLDGILYYFGDLGISGGFGFGSVNWTPGKGGSDTGGVLHVDGRGGFMFTSTNNTIDLTPYRNVHVEYSVIEPSSNVSVVMHHPDNPFFVNGMDYGSATSGYVGKGHYTLDFNCSNLNKGVVVSVGTWGGVIEVSEILLS